MPNPDGTPTEAETRQLFGNLANGSHTPNPAMATPAQGGGYGAYKPAEGSDKYGVTTGLNRYGLDPVHGTNAAHQQVEDWANDVSGNKPWLTRGESSQDTRNNFYYGGTPGGATAFNAGLGDASANLGADFGQVSGRAKGLGGMALTGQAQAQGRDPSQFVDQQSVGNNAFDRGAQLSSIGQLNQFANQAQGPSAAQAQLNQATDANMMNSLALARSGRGLGQSQAGLRQALGQNAITGQQAAIQSAALSAQEYQQYQQNKLNALGSMGGLAGQARQGDVQLGSYLSGTQQATQALGDQTALGYGNQALGTGQLQLGANQANAANSLGFYGLQNNVTTSNLNAGANYEQNIQNGYLQKMQQDASAVKGTDYTPYVAATAALGASLVGGPGAGAAAYTGTTAIGEAARR